MTPTPTKKEWCGHIVWRNLIEAFSIGMPWSFKYGYHQVTHENDNCYIVPTLEGMKNFNRGEMIVVDESGNLSICTQEVFSSTYEPVS